MNLQDFPRPKDLSRRGIHWSASCAHPTGSDLDWWVNELLDMNMKWVKLLDNGGGSSRHVCQKLLDNDIIPVVRMYRGRPNPGHLGDAEKQTVNDLIALGVRYFEPNNEPNLGDEWKPGEWQSGGRPGLVMQHWLQDAEWIINAGGHPGFPALAQCAHTQDHGSIPWYEQAFRWLVDNAQQQARAVFENGAWIASHNAVLNHCYWDGGKWHFEYPDDPICQADQPGKTIMQDDCSLMGYRVPTTLLKQHFGLQVPVISTEGGVFTPKSCAMAWDDRYPTYDNAGHATRVVAMYKWLRTNVEDFFFAMCPWLIANEKMGHPDAHWTEDAWYHKDGDLPVIAAVKAMGPEPPPEPEVVVEAVSFEEVLRNDAWNRYGLPYNPDFAFPQYARKQQLGSPVTAEFDFYWEGKQYRAQGFTGGIVYAEVPKFDETKWLPW